MPQKVFWPSCRPLFRQKRHFKTKPKLLLRHNFAKLRTPPTRRHFVMVPATNKHSVYRGSKIGLLCKSCFPPPAFPLSHHPAYFDTSFWSPSVPKYSINLWRQCFSLMRTWVVGLRCDLSLSILMDCINSFAEKDQKFRHSLQDLEWTKKPKWKG